MPTYSITLPDGRKFRYNNINALFFNLSALYDQILQHSDAKTELAETEVFCNGGLHSMADFVLKYEFLTVIDYNSETALKYPVDFP